jgi:hypothetical protein
MGHSIILLEFSFPDFKLESISLLAILDSFLKDLLEEHPVFFLMKALQKHNQKSPPSELNYLG